MGQGTARRPTNSSMSADQECEEDWRLIKAAEPLTGSSSLLPDWEDLISLPHLTKLYFTDSLRAAIPVAHVIVPSYRCALLWHSTSGPINAICSVLTRYYGLYFAATSTPANVRRRFPV